MMARMTWLLSRHCTYVKLDDIEVGQIMYMNVANQAFANKYLLCSRHYGKTAMAKWHYRFLIDLAMMQHSITDTRRAIAANYVLQQYSCIES